MLLLKAGSDKTLVVLRFTLVFVCAAAAGPKVLTQAREANEKAHYEEVTRWLRGADLSALAPDDRADAEFLLAVAELALAHDALSQKAFTHLWSEFPDYALPPYTAREGRLA